MSRIGKNPVTIPEGVTATLEGTIITVKGKLGELTQEISSSISVEIKDGLVSFSRISDQKDIRSLHGLYRALVQNMMVGVSVGYTKKLQFVGVGYPLVTLTSHDKQLLGAVAAKIRSFRPPEPYKGKGIRYVDEYVRRKAGKTSAS